MRNVAPMWHPCNNAKNAKGGTRHDNPRQQWCNGERGTHRLSIEARMGSYNMGVYYRHQTSTGRTKELDHESHGWT